MMGADTLTTGQMIPAGTNSPPAVALINFNNKKLE